MTDLAQPRIEARSEARTEAPVAYHGAAGIAPAPTPAAPDPLEAVREPIFVVGPGRSGTTLLRSLLSAHSRLAVPPETHFLANAARWGLGRSGEPADFEAFWQALTSGMRFRDLGVDAGRCRELIEAQRARSFAAVFRAMLAAYAEAAGKPRAGEKTPGHVAYLRTLFDWFPDARILVTKRDPRAVVASQLKTEYVRRHMRPASLRDGLVAGTRAEQVACFADHWARIFEQSLAPFPDDPRVRIVVYESLIADPEGQVREICRFVGEAFEPGMLTDRAAVPGPATARANGAADDWRRAHHAKSQQEISGDSLDKWREELTDGEIALIEGRCARPMREAGYAPVTPQGRQAVGRAAGVAIAAVGLAEARARASLTTGPVAAVRRRAKSAAAGMLEAGVEHGLPPAWTGWRWIVREPARVWLDRAAAAGEPVRYQTVHPESVATNPLPRNVPDRDSLPDDRGWWGYSFHDVPERTSGESFVATIPNGLVVWYRDEARADDFYPAIVSGDGRALDMREVVFRPRHGEVLRRSGPPVRLDRATWVLERVWHNYSHWFTAHLPKLLLLAEHGGLEDVLLPPDRPGFVDASLRMAGMAPEGFRTFDPGRPLRARSLTFVASDRFRPELLRLVPPAFGVESAAMPGRRIFVSRANAVRRRLVNEDEVWALLEPHGFERVVMEGLEFAEQVSLMKQTSVLCAPHGAGLTNMLFCPPGARIVEIADLGFPNPNFYALASALGHRYWLLPARSLGDGRPVDKDLEADVPAVRSALPGFAGGRGG
jgi:hypothetical protein